MDFETATVALVAPPRVRLTPAERARIRRAQARLHKAEADREKALQAWASAIEDAPLTAAAAELGLTPQALGNRLRRLRRRAKA